MCNEILSNGNMFLLFRGFYQLENKKVPSEKVSKIFNYRSGGTKTIRGVGKLIYS